MQLEKKYLDLADIIFSNVTIPLGKAFVDAEEIYFIVKRLVTDINANAVLIKKLTDSDITLSAADIHIAMTEADYDKIDIDYNYTCGLVFKFIGVLGNNEDLGTHKLKFTYPIHFLGDDIADTIQDPKTLKDLYEEMMNVDKFVATPGQTVFTVAGGSIGDNTMFSVEVEAEKWFSTNGVKGIASGLFTTDFATGTITMSDPMNGGTNVIITSTL